MLYDKSMDFYQHLENYLNQEEIGKLKESLSGEAKHAALLNLRKMSKEKFLNLFPHVIPHPIIHNAFLFDKNEYQLGSSIYHELGCFYIQEPSAMLPAYMLNPKENELVLDMCAAPGGKTIQSSLLMNDKGLIISNDISNSRAKAIVENIERLGLSNVLIISKDISDFSRDFVNKFDRIILDAPCSGSGLFRKDDKMMEDWSINKVYKFQELQKKLILNAYEYLKPGGIICYSTCSFSKEEDEDVISCLLDQTDAELIDIEDNPLLFKSKDRIGIHLFPYLFPGEGHYIALIKKPGTINQTNFKQVKDDSWVKLLKGAREFHYSFHYQDTLFLASEPFLIKNTPILRYGVKVGELLGNDIRYHYHYAHYVKEFPQIVDLKEHELKLYIKGETLPISDVKGDVLLTYNSIPLDIAKGDGRIIKNHYPKYLRKTKF